MSRHIPLRIYDNEKDLEVRQILEDTKRRSKLTYNKIIKQSILASKSYLEILDAEDL